MSLYAREVILRDLHPTCEHIFRGITADLKRAYEQGQTDRDIRPCEGFRTPREQEVLFAQRPVVEHLGKWFSPHSYGLAVKFKGVKPGGTGFQLAMSDHDIAVLHDHAKRWGLVVDPNDATRLVHSFWYLELRNVLMRRSISGRPANDNLVSPDLGDPVNDSHKV